ncbi:hypothetical protein K469DRAFT_706201 [Zopfia rhizophila CBS 207.26]|uniref:ferric-chelate reductase (NADPH) n=1 Tax=Zopfia rhizophila CBS 207.26 TaxID=1314779 RepID=A0A6A6ETV1_9PEZI|nr:hypothetical protein K469DRAFT_706201 [Zopfia rhizophila CBS 207.26]
MQVTSIFLISLGSAVGALVVWKLCQRVNAPTRRFLFSFLRKKLIYTLVIRRSKSTSDVNVIAFLSILLVIAANITACTLKLTDRIELARRCGTLFIINVVPLYLGGRTSLVADRILRIRLSDYSLMHRWMGRICVIQGLVHGIINASTSSPLVADNLLLSLLSALGGLSFLYVRRYMYEIFLKTHLVFSLALAVTLWIHVSFANTRAVVCLGVGSALWLMHHVAWLIRLIYRNTGPGCSKDITFNRLSNEASSAQAMTVNITLRRPWNISPGQYVYLTLPGITRHRAGFIQSHPYVIAWADGSDITLLIQRCDGFSDTLFTTNLQKQPSVIVDGPYGQIQPLDAYDKVLFIASGIGIAAHLLSIRHLLEAHQKQSARVRRLSLVWFIETSDQEAWASDFFKLLLKLDNRYIFTRYFYVPSRMTNTLEKETEKETERLVRTDQSLDLGWFINREALAEAGNMVVSVCGNPRFEDAVRRGVRASNQDMHFFTTGFHPEETHASRLSELRYSCGTKQVEN